MGEIKYRPTMMTTVNHWKCDGYARHIIMSTIKQRLNRTLDRSKGMGYPTGKATGNTQ